MSTKLHGVTDANGRPISFFRTAGQISAYTGAAALLDELPTGQMAVVRIVVPEGAMLQRKRCFSPTFRISM